MINIQDIIPFMKDGWVAMDKNKNWWFFEEKPQANTNVWLSGGLEEYLNDIFDIAPADDWTKSLICIKGKTMNNEWKFIDGYNNHYKINKDGVIVSVRKNIPLKCYITPEGYKMASLYKNGKSHKVFLHRLLAISFIPNIENKPYINHKDGNKLNNSLDNLEWCTKKENNAHAWRTGLCEYVRKINRENGKKRDMTEMQKKAKESTIGVKRSAETCKKNK